MDVLAPTRPAPAVPAATPAVAPEPVRRHAGCYWDHEQASWVAYAPLAVPAPRPVQD